MFLVSGKTEMTNIAELGSRGELTRGLDLAAVHRQHEPRAPVKESLRDALANQLDCVAGQPALIELVVCVGVHRQVFQKYGNALHRFLAQRALARGQLEGVRDLVTEVAHEQSLLVVAVDWSAGMLLRVVE